MFIDLFPELKLSDCQDNPLPAQGVTWSSGLVATSPDTACDILAQSFQCCEYFDSQLSRGPVNKSLMCQPLNPAPLPRPTPSLSPTPPNPEMRSVLAFTHLFRTLLWM